jgi:hypothetical protein
MVGGNAIGGGVVPTKWGPEARSAVDAMGAAHEVGDAANLVGQRGRADAGDVWM